MHGAAVWRGALCALVAGGALLATRRRRRAAEAAARANPPLEGRTYRLAPEPRPLAPVRLGAGPTAGAAARGALFGAALFAGGFVLAAEAIPAFWLVEVRAATPLRRAEAVGEYAARLEDAIDREEDA